MILYREFFMIHQLKADGLNHSQIARRLKLNRKTVRRHLSSEPDDTARVPRKARPSKPDRYRGHLQRRVSEHPQLCATRLLREIRAQGYTGAISILRDCLRQIRPAAAHEFEIRFETTPGQQAQVDFSCCRIRYRKATGAEAVAVCIIYVNWDGVSTQLGRVLIHAGGCTEELRRRSFSV